MVFFCFLFFVRSLDFIVVSLNTYSGKKDERESFEWQERNLPNQNSPQIVIEFDVRFAILKWRGGEFFLKEFN